MQAMGGRNDLIVHGARRWCRRERCRPCLKTAARHVFLDQAASAIACNYTNPGPTSNSAKTPLWPTHGWGL